MRLQKPGSLCLTIWRKDGLLIGLRSQEAYKVCLSVCLLIGVFIEVIVDLFEVIRDKTEIPNFPLPGLPQRQHLAELSHVITTTRMSTPIHSPPVLCVRFADFI